MALDRQDDEDQVDINYELVALVRAEMSRLLQARAKAAFASTCAALSSRLASGRGMGKTLKAVRGVERRLQRRLGDGDAAKYGKLLQLGSLKQSTRRRHLDAAAKAGQYAFKWCANAN